MSKNLADEKPVALISSSACKHEFGFLGRQPRGTPFPDECFTCTKMIDCMAVKAERPAPTPPPPPAPPQIRQEPVRVIKQEPVRLVQEVPRQVPVKPPVAVAVPQKKVVQAVVQKPEVKEEFLGENVLYQAPRSSDEFLVENAGMLYAQWSGTVLMDKETVEGWGKKVKEIELITVTGKKAKCKVQPTADARAGTVQVPAKLQANLGIAKGARVKIRAILK